MIKQHGNSKYPWSKWFDGRTHKIKPAKYGRDVESFRRQINGKAGSMGKKAITRVEGEFVYVAAVERQGQRIRKG